MSIAVVGKYAEHRDAYKSIYESLDHAGMANSAQVRIARIRSEELEDEGPERMLAGYDGILVPGGFGERGIEGKIQAIRYARERGVPFFGICLGMQCAAIEFARNVCNLAGAHSTEFDKETPHPVICLLDEQTVDHRQGRHDAARRPDGRARCRRASRPRPTAASEISERHRHRYEFNNIYRQQFAAHGLRVAGTSPDGALVEIIELPDHRWFVAVQFHPEFKSKPTAAHPLFAGFVAAAVEHHAAKHDRAAEAGEKAEKKPAVRPRRQEA